MKRTTINHLLQASNAVPEEVKKVQDEKTALQQTLENYHQEVQKSYMYYSEVSARTINGMKLPSWRKSQLQLQFCNLCWLSNVQVSAYWGMLAQPGSTYYALAESYFWNRRPFPKLINSSSVWWVSWAKKHRPYMYSFLPVWLHLQALRLGTQDSLVPWQYIEYQQELLFDGVGVWDDSARTMSFVRVSFLIAGHTKFSPDLVLKDCSNV